MASLEPHQPHRGSDVEAWLRQYRDQFPKLTTAWYALDDLLDEYRLRADVGRTLTDPRPSETPET